MSRIDRLTMLECENNTISFKTQCELLGVNRSGTYSIPRELSAMRRLRLNMKQTKYI